MGTVESYWATNLDLLGDDPGIELNDLGWLIYTKSEERPPARIGPNASVSRSMISHGCVIDGLVEHSVLSPGVRVAAGAEVRDSIVLFDAVIEEGAVLDRAIVDKEAHVGRRARVGVGDDLTPNRVEPERLTAGITLVGKRARDPARRRDRPERPDRPRRHRARLRGSRQRRLGGDRLRRIGRLVSEETPPIDRWLGELGLEVVAGTGEPGGPALSRDVVVDGRRRFDLRVTVAWVAGVGCSLWAYYGLEAMEIPKRVYARMLRANFDYPYVKFALTDDDRPMLMTELPTAALDRDELGRGLVRLAIVADRLLDETATAVADRGPPARLERTHEPQSRAPRGVRARRRVGDARLGAVDAARPASRVAGARAGPGVMARRPWVALLLALLALVVSGTPGRVRPVAAADPYTLESIASYQIRTEQREIGVRVDLEFTNTTPDPSGRFSVFEDIRLAVHDEATELAASDDQGALTVNDGVPEDRWRPRPRGDDPAARGSPIPGLRQRRAHVRPSRRRGWWPSPGAAVGRDLSGVELRDVGRGPRRHPVRLRDAGRWRSTHRGRRHRS